MGHFKLKTITALALAGLFVACAKERPIERRQDFDGNRFEKVFFKKSAPYLYKVTVVKTSARSAFGFAGMQSDMRAGYFDFTKDKLRFVSAVSIYEEDMTAGDLINSWDITHTQNRLAEQDGRVTNREEENEDISWQEKAFFKVDWNKATINEQATFPFQVDTNCWTKEDSNVVQGSQEATDKKISFTIAVDYQIKEECVNAERYQNQAFTHTVHYKYSFIPMPASDYQAYLYNGENDPLMSKYGYFNTVIQGMGPSGTPTNKFVMNRWHPKKTHTYYFVPGFPEEYKWIYNDPIKGIIPMTNNLFQQHGLDIRFEIKDSDGNQQFGDVGTSFINFVSQLDDGAPLGYGPSDANPFTGELVSANVIMWTGYFKHIIQRMNEQLEREKTLSANSSVFREIKSTLGADKAAWAETSQLLTPDKNSGVYFRWLLPQYTFGAPGNMFANGREDNLVKIPSADSYLSYLSPQNREAFGPYLKQVEQGARDRLKHVVKYQMNQKRNSIYDVSEPLADARAMLLDGKSEKEVLDAILYRVSIHEFGHNLSLRHNFYGSVDKANFKPPVNGVEQATSSVMDYMNYKDELDFHDGWEKYDEAAILYAYSDGQIDLSKTNNTTYLFCTDEHTFTNAMCNRFDKGSTPSEIVVSMIETYDDNYWVRNFRKDRPYWAASYYDGSMFQTMWQIKKMYKLLEDGFTNADVALKLGKVSGLSTADKTQIANDIRKDTKQAVKLAVAFYDSVIQQTTTDRPFKSTYEPWSGALQQIGIGADKMFAMMFLMGDMPILYNPNQMTATASFFTLAADPDIGPTVAKVLEKSVTAPGPMFLGYESFARVLYLNNAMSNQQVGGDPKIAEKMRIACFRASTFKERFKITDGTLLAKTVFPISYTGGTDGYFGATGNAMVLQSGGNYYVAAQDKNPYAYQIIRKAEGGSEPIVARTQTEVNELYSMYYAITQNGAAAACQ